MGNTISNIVTPSLSTDIELGNLCMSAFNKDFYDFITIVTTLIDDLYNKPDSSINNFNKIIFKNINDINNNCINCINNDNNNNIDSEVNIQRSMIILKNIMKIYTIKQTNHSDNDVKIDNDVKKDTSVYINNLYKKIKNFFDINYSTYIDIQKVINSCTDESNDFLQDKIKELLTDSYLKKKSIRIDFNEILKIIKLIEVEVEKHINFYQYKDDTSGWYHISIGSVSSLSRSGYTYTTTYNYYQYWINNNLKILKKKIKTKLDEIDDSISCINIIDNTINTIDYHILNKKTDKLHLSFTINDKTHDISINIGNYRITNYTVFADLLTTKIKTKIDPFDILFKIIYEDEFFTLISTNSTFTLKKSSTIMKYIGSSINQDINSIEATNEQDVIVAHAIRLNTQLKNENLNNVLSIATRYNSIITNLNTFNDNMNIQKMHQI
jgi:hypothetical protein